MFGIIIALWLFTLVIVDAIAGKISEEREENYNYKQDTGTRILIWVGWTFLFFLAIFEFM